MRDARRIDGAVDRRARRRVEPGDDRAEARERLGVGVRRVVRAGVRIAGPLRRRQRARGRRADADAGPGARPEPGALPLAVVLDLAGGIGPILRDEAVRKAERHRGLVRPGARRAVRGPRGRARRRPQGRASCRARGRAGRGGPDGFAAAADGPRARAAGFSLSGSQPRTNSDCSTVSGTVGQERERALARHRRLSRSSAAAPPPPWFAIQQPATRFVRPMPARQCRYTQRPFGECAVERIEDLAHLRVGGRHGVVADRMAEISDRAARPPPRRAAAGRTRTRRARSGRGSSRRRHR